MDDLKKIRNWSAALVAAVLVLRLAGFIGSFWTGVGFVALVAVFAILALVETTRRWVLPIYVAWAVFFIVLPMVGGTVLRHRPVLRDALEARDKAIELAEAERAHPTALLARLGWHKYCNRIEEIQGKWLFDRLVEGGASYQVALRMKAEWDRRPLPPTLLRDSAFVAMMDTLVVHRKACAALVAGSRDEEPGVLGRLRQNLAEKNPIGRFWFWVIAAILAGTILAVRRPLAAKGLGLAALLVLVAVGDSVLYGVKPAAAELTAIGTAHLPRGLVRGTPADIQSGVLCTADCGNERKLAALRRHTNGRYCSTVTAVRADSAGKPVEVATLRSSGDTGCDRAQESWMAEARWEARGQPYWLAYETVIAY